MAVAGHMTRGAASALAERWGTLVVPHEGSAFCGVEVPPDIQTVPGLGEIITTYWAAAWTARGELEDVDEQEAHELAASIAESDRADYGVLHGKFLTSRTRGQR